MAEKEKRKTGFGAKFAAIFSAVLWILGFALAFVIPKESRLIWVPDTMLLIGFWPLLYAWKPGWPWLVFGLFNGVIGFFLQVMVYIPDTNFTSDMIMVRKHLAEQHHPLSWILIGLLSTIFGAARMLIHLVQWIQSRRQKAADSL